MKWEHGVTTTGTDQIAILFDISDGPFAGQRITGYVYFTEKAGDRAIESLEHCGWDGDSLAELKGMGTKEVEIVCAEEDYNGKKQMKVQWINSPGGRGMAMHETMSPEQKLAFNERWKGEILRRKQSKGQKPDASFPFGANAPKKDGPPV